MESSGLKGSSNDQDTYWPNNVGILAMDIYFPNLYVEQADLETFNGVSAGKYTIGLGQKQMAFCNDREDINSICLTVTKSLLEKHSICLKDIGFLMIGTETIADKSKSIKTLLMDLFEESGNTDIVGLQTTNACYGGTASLFHAIDWIESSSWDGRYALVVAADIAVYASGPARPTGGCAGVAMLLGPNAPLVFDRKVRSTFMANVYDFYKPELSSEYPIVDGPLSNQCYIQAVDKCFQLYFEKANKQKGPVVLDNFDALLFHAPYSKLVQKSIARLFLLNYIQNSEEETPQNCQLLAEYRDIPLKDTYNDRQLEKILLTLSKEIFESKTEPSLMLTKTVGNSYTASLYVCLISFLLSEPMERLLNKRLLLFSYGSGLAATMFSLRVSSEESTQPALVKLLEGIADISDRLNKRHKLSAQQFEDTLNLREKAYSRAPYSPVGSIGELSAGTYYLSSVSNKFRRIYERVSHENNNI